MARTSVPHGRSPSLYFKGLAVFLCVCILLPEGVGTAAAVDEHAVPSAGAFGITVPAEWGSIEEIVQGPSAQTLIYVQDAHDSLEAQENIAKLISHWVKTRAVKTVYEEGYEGAVPTDELFGFIQDAKLKKKVSYFYMDKLRIGGAEYAHINRKNEFRLIGADSMRLHIDNVRWYRRSASHRQEIREELDAIGAQLQNLSQKYFPEGMKKWLQLKRKQIDDQLPLPAYLFRLKKLCLVEMPEEEFDRTYPSAALLAAAEERTRDVLVETALRRLDGRKLFSEIGAAEADYAGRLLHDETSRKLFEICKAFQLLRRLHAVELTSAEYESVKDLLRKFDTREVADFIAKLSLKTVVFSKQWEEDIRDALRFYETAKARDEAVEARLRAYAENSGESTAVLVFGGFHKDRIREILKRNGLSYVIVSPRISSVSSRHRGYYQKLMQGGRHRFEMPLQVRRGSRAITLGEKSDFLGLEPVRSEIRAVAEIISRTEGNDFSTVDREVRRQMTEGKLRGNPGKKAGDTGAGRYDRSEMRQTRLSEAQIHFFAESACQLWPQVLLRKPRKTRVASPAVSDMERKAVDFVVMKPVSPAEVDSYLNSAQYQKELLQGLFSSRKATDAVGTIDAAIRELDAQARGFGLSKWLMRRRIRRLKDDTRIIGPMMPTLFFYSFLDPSGQKDERGRSWYMRKTRISYRDKTLLIPLEWLSRLDPNNPTHVKILADGLYKGQYLIDQYHRKSVWHFLEAVCGIFQRWLPIDVRLSLSRWIMSKTIRQIFKQNNDIREADVYPHREMIYRGIDWKDFDDTVKSWIVEDQELIAEDRKNIEKEREEIDREYRDIKTALRTFDSRKRAWDEIEGMRMRIVRSALAHERLGQHYDTLAKREGPKYLRRAAALYRSLRSVDRTGLSTISSQYYLLFFLMRAGFLRQFFREFEALLTGRAFKNTDENEFRQIQETANGFLPGFLKKHHKAFHYKLEAHRAAYEADARKSHQVRSVNGLQEDIDAVYLHYMNGEFSPWKPSEARSRESLLRHWFSAYVKPFVLPALRAVSVGGWIGIGMTWPAVLVFFVPANLPVLSSFLPVIGQSIWLMAVIAFASHYHEKPGAKRLILAGGFLAELGWYFVTSVNPVQSLAGNLIGVALRVAVVFSAIVTSDAVRKIVGTSTPSKERSGNVRWWQAPSKWSQGLGVFGGFFIYFVFLPFIRSSIGQQEYVWKSTFDLTIGTVFAALPLTTVIIEALVYRKDVFKDMKSVFKSETFRAFWRVYPFSFAYWFPVLWGIWALDQAGIIPYIYSHNFSFFVWVALLKPIFDLVIEAAPNGTDGKTPSPVPVVSGAVGTDDTARSELRSGVPPSVKAADRIMRKMDRGILFTDPKAGREEILAFLQALISDKPLNRYMEKQGFPLTSIRRDFYADSGRRSEKTAVGWNAQLREVIQNLLTYFIERSQRETPRVVWDSAEAVMDKIRRANEILRTGKLNGFGVEPEEIPIQLALAVYKWVGTVDITNNEFTGRYRARAEILKRIEDEKLLEPELTRKILENIERAGTYLNSNPDEVRAFSASPKLVCRSALEALFPEKRDDSAAIVEKALALQYRLKREEFETDRVAYERSVLAAASVGMFDSGNLKTNRRVVENRFHSAAMTKVFERIRESLRRFLGDPVERPGALVYRMSGADISTPLLMTGATEFRFFDALPFNMEADPSRFEQIKGIYNGTKMAAGYVDTELLWSIGSAKVAILWELEALGAADVAVSKGDPAKGEDSEAYYVRFDWDADGTNRTRRTIIYRQRDFAGPDDFEGVFDSGKDTFYFQKADHGVGIRFARLPPVVISYKDTEIDGYEKVKVRTLCRLEPKERLVLTQSKYADIRDAVIFLRKPESRELAPGRSEARGVSERPFSLRRYMTEHHSCGSILIDKTDLARLTEPQWESFYTAAYLRSELRFVAYGKDDEKKLTRVLQERMRQLAALKNVVTTGTTAGEALKRTLPNGQPVFVSIDGLTEEAIRSIGGVRRVKAVKLKEAYEPIWIAVLYAVSDGGLQAISGDRFYIEDPEGRYTNVIAQFMANQVVAWAA